jgi:RNA polymerase sigma factor (sigma-70 family)
MEADGLLLAAARKMNGDALIEIFDLYAPALYKYAFHLSHNAVMADQIVGDVFAKLLEHLSAGTGPITNLRSYLYKMAYHFIVDEAHYSHRWVPIEAVDLIYTDEHSTQINAEDRVLFKTVLRAIGNNLTDDQRQVIILRFMEGFSLKDPCHLLHDPQHVAHIRCPPTKAFFLLLLCGLRDVSFLGQKLPLAICAKGKGRRVSDVGNKAITRRNRFYLVKSKCLCENHHAPFRVPPSP